MDKDRPWLDGGVVSLIFDHFSLGMIAVSCVLAPIAGLIVSSQDRADARSLAGRLVGVLGILFLLGCARFGFQRADHSGGLGLVVLFSSLILAVIMGTRAATVQPPTPVSWPEDDGLKPNWRDDELA